MSPDFSFFPRRRKADSEKTIGEKIGNEKSDIKRGKVFGKIQKRGIRGMRIPSCVIRVTEGETR